MRNEKELPKSINDWTLGEMVVYGIPTEDGNIRKKTPADESKDHLRVAKKIEEHYLKKAKAGGIEIGPLYAN